MKRSLLGLAGALSAAVVLMVGAGPAAAATTLAQVKAATAKFQDVNVAVANGYRSASPCVSSAQGVMGFHYIKRQLFASMAVVPSQPEALLYAPKAGGGVRLVGVEYLKVDNDQNLATRGDLPRLWGRPFAGPMLGHGPGMPKHYDLHVWLWQANPRGLFAEFNPTLTC